MVGAQPAARLGRLIVFCSTESLAATNWLNHQFLHVICLVKCWRSPGNVPDSLELYAKFHVKKQN